MTSISRQAFEESTGYNEVPKSAQDLLDLNAWPMWNMAWNRATPLVGPELLKAVESFVTTVDFECQNLDEAQTPIVLREAITIMYKKLEDLGAPATTVV